MAKNADPAAPLKEFYRPRNEPELGDPEADPPMTVRVRRWEDRFKPDAERVIRFGGEEGNGPYPWLVITGGGRPVSTVYTHDEVREWPISHPLHYMTAFAVPSVKGEVPELVGDMDVDAFQG